MSSNDTGELREAGQAERSIMHVDMDAFYASVELLRHPELRNRPVVVGGAGPRGVVAAASYIARAYGIHSAMPSARARRLCPELVVIHGDHGHYSEVSRRIMTILGDVTPLVEPLSLDEAFLDITGTTRSLGEPRDVARRLRGRILDETGLSCSVGIARNKFLAKLATESAKPQASLEGPIEGSGIHILAAKDEQAFLDALSVDDLWGVGPSTSEKLARLDVRTVGDLRSVPERILARGIGDGAARRLLALAHGRDDRPVVPHADPKSISHEETFASDVESMDDLRIALVRQADAVASRARLHGLRGRTVQLKVRFGDFTTVTRSETLSAATDRGVELCSTAWTMLLRLPVERGVRLLGVGLSNLTKQADQEQLTFDELFADSAKGQSRPTQDDWNDANAAIDEIRSRFGSEIIGPARTVGTGGSPGSHQWGPSAS